MNAIQIVADLLPIGSQQAATVNDQIVVRSNIPKFCARVLTRRAELRSGFESVPGVGDSKP